MPDETSCPEPEQWAAFIDGRIAEEKRAQFLRHLDGCELCLEAVSEAAAFQDQDEASTSPKVLPWRRRFSAWPVAALASAAAVFLAVILYWPAQGVSYEPASQLASALGAEVQPGSLAEWIQTSPPTLPGFGGEVDPHKVFFDSGVAWVQVQVLLRAGRADSAQARLESLQAALVGNSRWEAVAVSAERWLKVIRSASPGPPGPSADEPAADPDDLIYFQLGKWSESARLAALSGAVQFLKREETSQFLRELGTRDLPAPLAEELAELRRLLSEDVGRESIRRQIAQSCGGLALLL